MQKLISKTTFLEFLYCPKNIWLKLHKPELLEKFELSDFEKHLMEQGNVVESYARKLFLGGVEVTSTGEEACKETEKLIALKTPYIFQATFIVDGFIARNDVLAYNKPKDTWDVYEIKGTNSLKDSESKERNHIDDLSFQTAVLKRANIEVGASFLVHLNKEYVRAGELDIKSLFTIEDITETISEKLESVNQQMEAAKEYLNRKEEPGIGCDCHFKGRSNHCATFEHSHPDIPPYSIHDLIRIGQSKKKLNFLVENKIYHLEDIPDDFELSTDQKNQLRVYKDKKSSINLDGIREEISSLPFPLYFLDYEAYAPAIPAFSGYHPYNFIPFQFSLHILRKSDDTELEHKEFLHTKMSDPSEEVAKLLEKYIEPKGTVIVWFKTFEKTFINEKIAERLPEYKNIIDRINNQIYDLRDVFTKQHYVHPEFKGKTSIKKVLPVLTPENQYKDLVIHEGGQASEEWWKMVSASSTSKESKEIAENLKIYCGLDTYAMYAIWKHLYQMI
jgi:CRISPR/Cas system-associated exonuclease Cas4 (RecB family)